MISPVTISAFSEISLDERGLTAEFLLPRKQDAFLYLTRKAGTLSGNAFHEGTSSATNPKVFLLLTGKIIFSYREINTSESVSIEVFAPAKIEVSPYVTHKVVVLEDCVMLEGNSLADIKNDRLFQDV